jgi:uncharacterized membrane protein (UPF0127 family)
MVRRVLLVVLLGLVALAVARPEMSCGRVAPRPRTLAGGEDDYGVPTQPNRDLPTVRMTLGGRAFTLEVARTDLQIRTGMMFRKSLPEDHGMIFVFPDEAERSFWMKNCEFPLDVIFVDARQRIVSFPTMQPHDETGTPSHGPARWAIEINGGLATQLGLRPGDRVEIPPGAQ